VSASLQGLIEEAQDLPDLPFERVRSREGKAGANEPRSQLGVAQTEKRTRRRGAVAGRNDDSPLTLRERLGDAAYIGGDDRQPGRGCLVEHLRKPLGQRHVQEGIGAPVMLPQLLAGGDVARKLERRAEAKRLRLLLEMLPQRAVSDHLQSPVSFRPEPGQNLRQQQGVLLGLEPSDGEDADGVSPFGIRLLLGCELGFANQGDATYERLASAVVLRELGAHDDRGAAAGQSTEGEV
jgi:hypothetical protein